jgi:hypothetical protein
VARVASNQLELVMKSRCSNQDVGVGDHLAAASQVPTNACELSDDSLVERQHGHCAQEAAEAALSSLRISAIVDAFVDLAESNQADGNAGRREAPEERDGIGPAIEPNGRPNQYRLDRS